MGSNDQSEQFRQYAEQLRHHLAEDGGAGGTIGPEGLTLGIPNWAERTRDQRFSERVKTHGYPLGFAKSQYPVRERLVDELHQRIESFSGAEQAMTADAHEAVAWALDAERFLGSFNQGERGGFPVEAVDKVADQLLAWLDQRGFAVVSKASQPVEGTSLGVTGQEAIGSKGEPLVLAPTTKRWLT